MKRVLGYGLSILVIIAAIALGLAVGFEQAVTKDEAHEERLATYESAYSAAFRATRQESLAVGTEEGVTAGKKEGSTAGARAGTSHGEAAANAELEEAAAAQAAADAEAAEAAQAAAAEEAAIPAPCAHLPDSTARRMCIGAVEAGVYP